MAIVEMRAEVDSIEKTQLKLQALKAVFKGDYSFKDYIYHPKGSHYDLNAEFMRMRVYQKTNWDQKNVELMHKKRAKHLGGEVVRKKWAFDTMEDAAPYLIDHVLAFSYKRTGFEYEIDGMRIFLEDVEGLAPSLEILGPSKETIDSLFQEVAAICIFNDSVPRLVEMSRKNGVEK